MYGLAKYLTRPDSVPMYHLSKLGGMGDTDDERVEVCTPKKRASITAYVSGGMAQAIAERNGVGERSPAEIFKDNFPTLLEYLRRWQRQN